MPVTVWVRGDFHLYNYPLAVSITIFLVLLLSDGLDDAELLPVL